MKVTEWIDLPEIKLWFEGDTKDISKILRARVKGCVSSGYRHRETSLSDIYTGKVYLRNMGPNSKSLKVFKDLALPYINNVRPGDIQSSTGGDSFANFLNNCAEVTQQNLDMYFRVKTITYNKDIQQGLPSTSAKYRYTKDRKDFVREMVNPLNFLSFLGKPHQFLFIKRPQLKDTPSKTDRAKDRKVFEEAEKMALERGMRFFTRKYRKYIF